MSLTPLELDLQNVSPAISARVHKTGGIDDATLLSLVSHPPSDPALSCPDHPDDNAVSHVDSITEKLESEGEQAIKDGKVAFVVLAGGSGTRVGEPKAFMQIPGVGISLLTWKMMQAGNMPVWIMTTPDLMRQMHQHVSMLAVPVGLSGVIFDQFEGYRLTPDNRLSFVSPGVPELHPLGHGDVGPALNASGLLDENPNVKHIVVCNVDNVLGSPHPGVIGRHIARGKKVTCELVDRVGDVNGGVPAWVGNRLQVVETFRLPDWFDAGVRWQSTNTMIIDVDALREPISWRYHRVRKVVDGRVVDQHERLLQQYTEAFETGYVVVPRGARYCPVKVMGDIENAGKVLQGYRFK